jgi:eukaryotic-like serine/threonine-protein kinase
MQQSLIGQTIERYHILEQLGEGGMAIVYKAYDTRLERYVALKVIRAEKLTSESMDKTLKRFEREARALARLTHPNIVPVTDYGEFGDKPYLVMPYIPGETLKRHLMGRPIPWHQAARFLAPVARALEHAHQHNIIHRDVKPSNILITANGQPMLSDFGVAKVLETEETSDLTGTGVGVGTPDYMAPEQGMTSIVDERVDIYALGVVFYELVTGRRPYRADTPMAVMLKKNTEPLPRPTSLVPDLPPDVENHLLKALARDPANRFQTMTEMAVSLENFAEGKLPASKAPPAKQPDSAPPRSRKNPLMGLGIGLAGFICLASLVTGGLAAVKWLGANTGATATLTETTIPQTEPAPVDSSTPTDSFVASTPTLELPTDTPTAAPDAGRVSPTDGMSLLYVPAGEFPMGGNVSRFDQSKPEHTIYLDAFWIDKIEVTNAMFSQFASQTGYVGELEKQGITWFYNGSWYDRSGAGWRNPFGPGTNLDGRADYPVIQVSWNDAVAYCTWVGRRLPTEAEWEKAARGSSGYLYPWGNTPPSSNLANYGGQIGDIVRVGSYPENISPYGALDMAGNVYEWVADYFSITYYASSPPSNPTGPSSGRSKVMRGGSWQLEADRLLTYEREASPPSAGNSNLGFRCAQSANP